VGDGVVEVAQGEVDRVAEQHQLHHRDADDHRQRDAVAAQLPQLLDHDREQPASFHAARSRSALLPPVTERKTSSRLGGAGATSACSPALCSASCSRSSTPPPASARTRRALPTWATLITPGASTSTCCARRGCVAWTTSVAPATAPA